MTDWAGFTDADLKKLKTQTHTDSLSNARLAPKRGQQPAMAVGQRRSATANQRKPAAKKVTPAVSTNTPTLSQDQMLSKPKISETKPQPTLEADPQSITNNTTSKPPPSTDTGSHRHSQDGSTTEEAPESEKDLVVDEQEIFKHEAHTMESFQKQQKMIEELNKKKKQMLASAIQERAKKAKAESAKLIELQKELNKLDQLLTVDVSIMRDKIEAACREFFEAQKRYDRAEKEYVDSKIDLHHKMELKEQLTEHLYTVIYQNEMRKSKKLAELMAKLEMEDGENPTEIPECDMPHPSLISPVQLPMGRYGQIGLVKVDLSKASTEQKSAEESTEGKREEDSGTASAEKETSAESKSDDKSSDNAASTEPAKEGNSSTGDIDSTSNSATPTPSNTQVDGTKEASSDTKTENTTSQSDEKDDNKKDDNKKDDNEKDEDKKSSESSQASCAQT